MRPVLPPLLALLASLFGFVPGWAAEGGYLCTFETECFGADGCSTSGYELRLAISGDEVAVSDVSADFTAPVLRDGEGAFVGFHDRRADGSQYLLTLSEDGAARYSVHMPREGLLISYLGACASAEN